MTPIIRTAQLQRALAEYRAAEAALAAALADNDSVSVSRSIDKARAARRDLCRALDSAERISALSGELADSLRNDA